MSVLDDQNTVLILFNGYVWIWILCMGAPLSTFYLLAIVSASQVADYCCEWTVLHYFTLLTRAQFLTIGGKTKLSMQSKARKGPMGVIYIRVNWYHGTC